jgi:DNA helicase HerA-like ATPase
MSQPESQVIGEVVDASVLGGINVKLSLTNPENIKTGYPVIAEGQKYDFYCVVADVFNPAVDVVDSLATSDLGKLSIPAVSPGLHKGYFGSIFYSKILLEPIQLIDKTNGTLTDVETIPPYFTKVRLATPSDVKTIYQPSKTSMPVGSLRGIPEFEIPIDFDKLTQKAFALLGRTSAGKSFLNKIICNFILKTGVASVLLFDMHNEYGTYSATDNSRGLKFYFPEKIEWLTLEPEKNKEAAPFFIDPASITPEDLILAITDLTVRMQDAIWTISAGRGRNDLLTAIRDTQPGTVATIPDSTLLGLKARIARLDRLQFVRPKLKSAKEDSFTMMLRRIREGKSIVLDFGKYGRESMVYLFVANIISRRLHEIYTGIGEDLPRLVIFLEEAHKFLDPKVAELTIFSILAREMRKFNLIVSIIDQRPSKIDDEVMSQRGNRMILSLKDPKDISAALAGIPKAKVWTNIAQSIPLRTALIVGDAVRVPTVIDVLDYSEIESMIRTTQEKRMTSEEITKVAKNGKRILRSIK